ncbi:hypothetical protein ASPWEDRAFT_175166 [Aspergillus wentii DTO 134E9]|uniref:Extracellular membrane protein CFEM domain-containing protein n=1 Tax=Aspergillus wentii DTO 134E9 TaxID=1073089 RepID=A0A1L9RAC3_ASPWE|nr:uncharacterized protein ASPWEDRAFT_175166 [Aspergillus wentii DTO 134E9]KAI9934437.1 hypothetical protein MW887_000051 [Aspergillus wentii]OJJ31848.1 hypothetical protein ASPWEDRAFT_175166 [Aspergillus wentii DTO 134E9]
MIPARTFLIIAVITFLSSLVHAQTNVTSNLCADPSAYSSCNANVDAKGRDCVVNCNGSVNCVVACGCTAHQDYLNCMAEACWNQVYSCEYQIFIQQYLTSCPDVTDPIPFWPPPKNAPGGCSCNISEVYDSVRRAEQEQSSCLVNASNELTTNNGVDVAKKESGCACCGISAILSAIHDICPDTIIPAPIAFYNIWPFSPTNNLPTLPPLPISVPVPEINISDPDWSACETPLKNYNCMSDLGFSAPSKSSKTFYRPDNMPKNGTETLHNTGTEVTSPPSGTVFTWHQSTATYTVTASAYVRERTSNETLTGTRSGLASAMQTAGSESGASRVGGSMGGLFVEIGLAWWLV